MNTLIRINIIFLIIFIFIGLYAEDILLERIAVVINDTPILQSEINKGIDVIESSPFYSDHVKDSLKNHFIESLIDEKILYQISREESIKIDSSSIYLDVKKYINETLKSSFPDESAYEEFLKANNINEKELEHFYFKQRELSFIKQQVLYKKMITLKVNNSEIDDYYEENRDSFYIPITLDLYHIAFVIQPDSMNLMSVMQKVDALVRSLKGGSPFSEVAKQYSDDESSKYNGGLIKYKKYVDISPEMVTFLYTFKESDTLIYTQSRKGFHIIEIENADNEGIEYRQIVVKFNIDKDDSIRIKNKTREIKNLIENGNLSFEEAAQKYSDDYATGVNGGFVGRIPITSIEGEIKKVLENLENDKVSSIMNSDFGYELFMVRNKEGGYESSFEDVKPFIRSILEGKQIEKKIKEIIKNERANMYIKRMDG